MSQPLIDNLPLIAAAPDGIKALRGLILDLAVRGKLVPQDPQDEPACELLKRIAAEKKNQFPTRQGRGQIHQPSPLIDKFDLPPAWEWSGLGDLSLLITDGTHFTPKYIESGVPFLSIKDISGGDLDFSDTRFISTEEHLEINARCNPERNDILICRIGTLGKPVIVDTDVPFSIFVSVGLIKMPKTIDVSRWAKLALDAPFMQSQYEEVKAGGSHTNKLNLGDIPRLTLPLPPLAEQRRIVAKVDELMALCDRLEAQQADAEAVHATLVKTLLDTLTQSQDADDFAANWHRLSQHFPTIFTTEASVDALKQTVVELAVTGRLVQQNPDDEPAAAFLERIRSARAQLIARKIIKADKSLPALTADALPFALPSGWEWVRFDEVVLISGGLTLGRTFVGRELVSRPYLRVANVQRGHLALSEIKEVLVPPEEVEKYRLLPQDLLITEGGDWDKVGRTAIWHGEIADCLHQNHVFKARPFVSDFNDRWAELYLNSAIARSYFAGASKQTTNLASINMTQLKACLLPIPPLAEQARIVAKVDELRALCDTLKAQIAESRKVQRLLAAALIDQTLAA